MADPAAPISLAQTPALEPPPGITPDFDTLYRDLQPLFIAVNSLYIVLATLVVGARLLVKAVHMRLLQIEDCA